MKTKNETAAQTPQELLDDLRTLVAEAEKMVSDAVTEHSDETIGALRSRFESAQARFADVYATAREKVTAGAKSTDEAIRANPYQSLAIALGTGLIVGLCLGRRGE